VVKLGGRTFTRSCAEVILREAAARKVSPTALMTDVVEAYARKLLEGSRSRTRRKSGR
jgi:hypothetical protein